MKPLLIIPPAPTRWPALADLLRERGQPWLGDMEIRVAHGVPGAEDAFAILPSGGHVLASACVNKCGEIGVLEHVYTRPEHRRRGYARMLTETVLSWFEMTGGKWLFLFTTSELNESLYRKFGFKPLRRAVWAPFDRLTMLRVRPELNDNPLADVHGPLAIRDLTRADWPAIVTLLQYRPGPDPRVPLEESAVTANLFGLDLVNHLEQGKSRLLGAVQDQRLVALASVAIDQHGKRTYAMLIPPSESPPELREAAIEQAHSAGYKQVDFPMETLDKLPAWAAAGKETEPAPTPAPAAPSKPTPFQEPPPVE